MKKVRGTQNSAFIAETGAILVRLFYVIILLSEHIESAIDRKPKKGDLHQEGEQDGLQTKQFTGAK